jgi:hypothetical protein
VTLRALGIARTKEAKNRDGAKPSGGGPQPSRLPKNSGTHFEVKFYWFVLTRVIRSKSPSPESARGS